MMQGSPAAPPWGAYRPGLLFRGLVRASRAVPQLPVIKSIAFLLRRLARAVQADPIDVEHWGLRLRLQARGNISESTFLFMPRRWDRRERRYLQRRLRPGAVFIDVGANAGGYVWSVLGLLGEQCRIIAVEASPELGQRLRFNLATNGIRNVDVLSVAVGASAGEGWLRVDARNQGQNTLHDVYVRDDVPGGFRVPVRPLPEILAAAGVERVDALKIDVEGLEAAILNDFFDRAAPRLWPRILITERRDTAEYATLAGRLAQLGYVEELRTRLNVALRFEPGEAQRSS